LKEEDHEHNSLKGREVSTISDVNHLATCAEILKSTKQLAFSVGNLFND
jgi:hypothetical protein